MRKSPISREVGKAIRRSNEPTRVLMDRYDITTVQVWRARGADPNRRRTYDDGLLDGAEKAEEDAQYVLGYLESARTEADQLAKALEWSLGRHAMSVYRGDHDYHSAVAVLDKYRESTDGE